MALESRTLFLPRRPRPVPIFLGDFGLELLAPIAGAAITAGGTVGSAFIVADAQKSVAKDQEETALQVAANQAAVQLATLRAQTAQNAQNTAVASQAVSSGVWAVLALGLAALFLGGR